MQGTRIGETVEDRAVLVDDYPLLPVRRRFWEQCFRQIDAAGTHSQLRSQLRIIHDAVARISDRPLGSVVPADELYEALAPEMVNTGVLLREINERIIKVGASEGTLARRVCGLVFLIGKLKRDGEADIGVRANKEHIADLLVDDLTADNGKLRSEVETTLQTLAAHGVLMQVGDEFRLQTREGSEWDREFRNRQTKLGADDATLQIKREQLLYAKVEGVVRGIKLTQGAAKEPRQVAISREASIPALDGASVPMWLQDGWSAGEKQIVEAVRSAGATSPIIAVFIPRQSADDLRRLLIEAEAARQTLDAKGNPTTAEGLEARGSMESRRSKAAADLDRLLTEIAANSKVFQGGGNELLNPQLDERIRTAADDALVRLFPQFKDADSKVWETVIKRAREESGPPIPAHRLCRCHGETPGLSAGQRDHWRRQEWRGDSQGAAGLPFRLAAGCRGRRADCLAPTPTRLGNPEWCGRSTRPAGSEQDLQGGIQGREVAHWRAGSVEDSKAHHPARCVQERGGGDEGSGIPFDLVETRACGRR